MALLYAHVHRKIRTESRPSTRLNDYPKDGSWSKGGHERRPTNSLSSSGEHEGRIDARFGWDDRKYRPTRKLGFDLGPMPIGAEHSELSRSVSGKSLTCLQAIS